MTQSNKKTYLVTGGAGFIGTNTVKKLIESGHEVRVLDNYIAGKKTERFQSGAEYIEGDIRNRDDVHKAVQGVAGIFHLAAVPRVPYSVEHPDVTNDHNVTGTLNVLMAARDNKVKRVVFAASSSIYGGDKGEVALTEEMSFSPKSPYALQKLIGVEYCRLFAELYGLETVSLVYFNIYGPYMDPDGAYALAIGKFLRQRKKGEPMTVCGDGEYYRGYTHVDDCVRANILAMESDQVGVGELINAGNSKSYSVNQLTGLIGGETVEIAPRPGDVRYSQADISKAKKLLNWEPTISLETGIELLKKDFGIDG
jgi:nucleoside-diphosphate-sugar epimerase